MKGFKFILVALVALFSLSAFASTEVKKVEKSDLTKIVNIENVTITVVAEKVVFEPKLFVNYVQQDYNHNLIFTTTKFSLPQNVIFIKNSYPISDRFLYFKIYNCNEHFKIQKIILNKEVLFCLRC